VEPETPVATATNVEAPRGMYPARLDDKGRLKLPATFQQFFANLGERKLFVTSLDRRIAQIYPMAIWRQNEIFFESYREDPELAENVAFNAADLGAEAEMDSQGRITVNPDLRRELNLEGQELHLFAYKGRVEILNETLYRERKQSAMQEPRKAQAALERAGLR
jgi:MraZ protein